MADYIREPVPLTDEEQAELEEAGIPRTLEASFPAPVVVKNVFVELRRGDGAEGMRLVVDVGSNGDFKRELLWFDQGDWNIYGLTADQMRVAGRIAGSGIKGKVNRQEQLVDESSIWHG